jgi:3-deoxy-manno-octulosonate cytidylyltransferase (CMP-KDO synthetase)
MSCIIVVPARMASSRFPGKPLVDLAGKPMLQWVVERASQANVSERVVVATPDKVIVDACNAIGAEAILTSIHHPTGTDRIAEVARAIKADVYVNVQGDEPLVQPSDIRACAHPLIKEPMLQMGSVFADCPDDEVDNPAVVKVVTALNGDALYFSRYAVPYPRNARESVKKHIGLYAYTAEVLEGFSKWPQSPLEKAESLEQLRFLENGVRIRMSKGVGSALAVDTPEQADQVRAILATL